MGVFDVPLKVPFNKNNLCVETLYTLFNKACESNEVPIVEYLVVDIPNESHIISKLKTAIENRRVELACALLDGITFTDKNYSIIIEINNRYNGIDNAVMEKILDRCKPITHEIANLLRAKYADVVNNATKDISLSHMFATMNERDLIDELDNKYTKQYAFGEIKRRIAAYNEKKDAP